MGYSISGINVQNRFLTEVNQVMVKIISAHFCPVPSVGKNFKLVRKSNQTDRYWILATYLTFTNRVQILFEIIPSR